MCIKRLERLPALQCKIGYDCENKMHLQYSFLCIHRHGPLSVCEAGRTSRRYKLQDETSRYSVGAVGGPRADVGCVKQANVNYSRAVL